MIVCCKLGTLSMHIYRIKYRRKLPKVGDTIFIRLDGEPGAKWIKVIVDEAVTYEHFTPFIRASMK